MNRILIIPGIGRTSLQLGRFLTEAFQALRIPSDLFCYNPERFRGIPSRLAGSFSKRLLFYALHRFRPTVLLSMTAILLKPPLLREIKEKFGMTLANWCIDDPLFLKESITVLPFYDFFFTHNPASEAFRSSTGTTHVSVLTFGCSPTRHRKLSLSHREKAYYGSDVAFVGEVSLERKVILEALSDVDLKIWSKREVSSLKGGRVVFTPIERGDPLYPHFTGNPAWGEEMVKVYNASKMLLNIHSMGGEGTNMRTFEITGCGSFLLVDRHAHLEELLQPGKECVQFENTKDLRDKIHYYLAHDDEREEIAKRGYEKTHHSHTYAHRAKELLGCLNSRSQ